MKSTYFPSVEPQVERKRAVNGLTALAGGPESVVTLDTLLGKELFNKKEAEGPGTEMLLRLVLPRLMKKLQLCTLMGNPNLHHLPDRPTDRPSTCP